MAAHRARGVRRGSARPLAVARAVRARRRRALHPRAVRHWTARRGRPRRRGRAHEPHRRARRRGLPRARPGRGAHRRTRRGTLRTALRDRRALRPAVDVLVQHRLHPRGARLLDPGRGRRDGISVDPRRARDRARGGGLARSPPSRGRGARHRLDRDLRRDRRRAPAGGDHPRAAADPLRARAGRGGGDALRHRGGVGTRTARAAPGSTRAHPRRRGAGRGGHRDRRGRMAERARSPRGGRRLAQLERAARRAMARCASRPGGARLPHRRSRVLGGRVRGRAAGARRRRLRVHQPVVGARHLPGEHGYRCRDRASLDAGAPGAVHRRSRIGLE